MTDLTKFSKDELKKAYAEIGAQLKKADEKDYDPNQTTPDAAHLEDKIGGTSKKIEDKGGETEKSAVKKDFPPEENGNEQPPEEEMTEPSMVDVCQQILQILQEIRGKLNTPTPPAVPAPTDQVQLSATPPTPTATPATTPTITKPESKSDININVTKSQVEEILKGMGFTPSGATPKPKAESGHPIEKGDEALDYQKISKMTWDELHAYNAKVNPGSYY